MRNKLILTSYGLTTVIGKRRIEKALGFEKGGKVYIGASAGAMIAGVSIEEAIFFDKNFVRMDDFTGLGLFDGVVIPHYTKEQLRRYIKNSPGIKDKYNEIISVTNAGCITREI